MESDSWMRNIDEDLRQAQIGKISCLSQMNGSEYLTNLRRFSISKTSPDLEISLLNHHHAHCHLYLFFSSFPNQSGLWFDDRLSTGEMVEGEYVGESGRAGISLYSAREPPTENGTRIMTTFSG